MWNVYARLQLLFNRYKIHWIILYRESFENNEETRGQSLPSLLKYLMYNFLLIDKVPFVLYVYPFEVVPTWKDKERKKKKIGRKSPVVFVW